MEKKHQSPQEVLLGPYFESSLVAPLVFSPDNWSRSKGSNREPSDFAWVCNNCVMLIHLTERKSQANPSRAARVAAEAIGHNLVQLRGWMKSWRGGQILKGENDCAKFSIPYSDDYHIIALSVVHHGDPVCVPHPEIAAEIGITCCSTVTQGVLQKLIQCGGSALDLLAILMILEERGPTTQNDAIKVFDDYFERSLSSALGRDISPGTRIDEHSRKLFRLISTPRNFDIIRCKDVIVDPSQVQELRPFAAYNDIPLSGMLAFLNCFRWTADQAMVDPTRNIGAIVTFGRAIFGCTVSTGWGRPAMDVSVKIMEKVKEAKSSGNYPYMINLAFDLSSGPRLYTFDADHVKSTMEDILDDWAAPGRTFYPTTV